VVESALIPQRRIANWIAPSQGWIWNLATIDDQALASFSRID
jgi:hypothetical protein